MHSESGAAGPTVGQGVGWRRLASVPLSPGRWHVQWERSLSPSRCSPDCPLLSLSIRITWALPVLRKCRFLPSYGIAYPLHQPICPAHTDGPAWDLGICILQLGSQMILLPGKVKPPYLGFATLLLVALANCLHLVMPCNLICK